MKKNSLLGFLFSFTLKSLSKNVLYAAHLEKRIDFGIWEFVLWELIPKYALPLWSNSYE